MKTKDFTPLKPSALDYKFYARGVGLIRDVEVSSPGNGSSLVSVTHAPQSGNQGQDGQGQHNDGQH
jgi:hypothetical protein